MEQLSVVSYPLSVVGCRLWVVGYPLATDRNSAISRRFLITPRITKVAPGF